MQSRDECGLFDCKYASTSVSVCTRNRLAIIAYITKLGHSSTVVVVERLRKMITKSAVQKEDQVEDVWRYISFLQS